MNSPVFTVFTPTYNRAYMLPKLYKSLKIQSFKDFEWLIVDDGSTDETESLIKHFIQENEITIRYYKQKNQGKHIAINTALKLLENQFFVIIDSDDYLTANTLMTCNELGEKIKNKSDYAGFSFIRFSDKITFDPQNYGNKEWTEIDDYELEFNGEMIFVLKSQIAKKFSFPVFKDEKFCQESVFILEILKQYKLLFTNHVLAHGDYLDDGLSQNIYKRLLENPKYAMLAASKKIIFANTKAEKIQIAKVYWDIAIKTQPKYKFFKFATKVPLSYTWQVLSDKLKKRRNK